MEEVFEFGGLWMRKRGIEEMVTTGFFFSAKRCLSYKWKARGRAPLCMRRKTVGIGDWEFSPKVLISLAGHGLNQNASTSLIKIGLMLITRPPLN
jgi:hypothetical protein